MSWSPRRTPLWDAYQSDLGQVDTSFAIPGHKGRADIAGSAVTTDRPLQLDVTGNGLNWGTVHVAERLAAEAFGAGFARFSVNGSSAANQAALMGVLDPGDKVLVSRASHKSVLYGLIYSGATPVWVAPRVTSGTGLPTYTEPEDVDEALRRHPDIRAVFLTDPTYVGSVSDIEAISRIVHRRNIPFIVDAAWGAHFGWHPDLPPSPIAVGADIMVTSTHKTLPAYTQSAILFAQPGRVNMDRLNHIFDGTQTTSPAASILASIDLARDYMETHGQQMVDCLLPHIAMLRDRLRSVHGVHVLKGPNYDPMKLVILTRETGLDGRLIANDLAVEGVDVETANRDLIVPQITVADTPASLLTLSTHVDTAFSRHTATRAQTNHAHFDTASLWAVTPVVAVTPREAFFSPTRTVTWAEAEGYVSADTLTPYPPGVPLVAPGERLTRPVLDALTDITSAGIRVAYATDPTLQTFRVLNQT